MTFQAACEQVTSSFNALTGLMSRLSLSNSNGRSPFTRVLAKVRDFFLPDKLFPRSDSHPDCLSAFETITSIFASLAAFLKPLPPESPTLTGFIAGTANLCDSISLFLEIIEPLLKKDQTAAVRVECRLFNFAHRPGRLDRAPRYFPRFLPVYLERTQVMGDRCVLLLSCCESGKTLLLPFFACSQICQDSLTAPFFVMLQPGPILVE
jgi:hypothetical protein